MLMEVMMSRQMQYSNEPDFPVVLFSSLYVLFKESFFHEFIVLDVLTRIRKHFQIRDRRIEHWGMFSLQSDFSRHSLTKLLGAVELRTFICYCISVVLCHF